VDKDLIKEKMADMHMIALCFLDEDIEEGKFQITPGQSRSNATGSSPSSTTDGEND